jgi:hypothetical protein
MRACVRVWRRGGGGAHGAARKLGPGVCVSRVHLPSWHALLCRHTQSTRTHTQPRPSPRFSVVTVGSMSAEPCGPVTSMTFMPSCSRPCVTRARNRQRGDACARWGGGARHTRIAAACVFSDRVHSTVAVRKGGAVGAVCTVQRRMQRCLSSRTCSCAILMPAATAAEGLALRQST